MPWIGQRDQTPPSLSRIAQHMDPDPFHCEIKRWLPSHILRVSKIQDYVKNLVMISIAALKSLKKHKRVCLYLLENPRKKEFVVSELARDRVSKFLLVGSNRMLVV